jgi:hypothetical protein
MACLPEVKGATLYTTRRHSLPHCDAATSHEDRSVTAYKLRGGFGAGFWRLQRQQVPARQ